MVLIVLSQSTPLIELEDVERLFPEAEIKFEFGEFDRPELIPLFDRPESEVP